MSGLPYDFYTYDCIRSLEGDKSSLRTLIAGITVVGCVEQCKLKTDLLKSQVERL